MSFLFFAPLKRHFQYQPIVRVNECKHSMFYTIFPLLETGDGLSLLTEETYLLSLTMTKKRRVCVSVDVEQNIPNIIHK